MKRNKIMFIGFLATTAIILMITFVIPVITPFGVIASAATTVAAYINLFKLLRAERKANKEGK